MAETSESTSPSSKKRCILLSLKERRKQKAAERFAKVSSKEMETCKKPSCKNTDKSQLWAFCVFQSWIENQDTSDSDDNIWYNESYLFAQDSERVCSMMCQFIIEARQRIGSLYSPKMLL